MPPQANKIPPLRSVPGRVPALGNKIPPQRALRDFKLLRPTRLGKPSSKIPVSERSERVGVFPAPRGHAPGHGPD